MANEYLSQTVNQGSIQVKKNDSLPTATNNTVVQLGVATNGYLYTKDDSGNLIRHSYKHNFAATSNPGVGDDGADGYSVGSVWINTTADTIWQCADSTNGAAVWKQLDASGGGVLNNFSASADPTVNDDSGDGYDEGSLWVNTTANTAWICVDATAGAADWNQIDGAGGGGAPADASYITASAESGLSNETTIRTYLEDTGANYYNRDTGDEGLDFSNAAYATLICHGALSAKESVKFKRNSFLDGYDGMYMGLSYGDANTLQMYMGYNQIAAYVSGLTATPTAPGTAGWRRLDFTENGIYDVPASGLGVVKKLTPPLHKFDATATPTVNDDTGDGYEVGSLWFDVTNDKVYGCTDASSGAAVWKELSSASSGQMATGTYTGDGAATKAITGLGFQPKYVYIYPKATTPLSVVKTNQDTTGAFTLGVGYYDDWIVSLDSGGFTVGDGTNASGQGNLFNVNARVYVYSAWSY